MGFEQVLEKYRKIAFSERDKGTRFERLMQAYLKTDPRYTSELKEVWLWSEFPFKADFGGKDTGIDIVAKTYDDEYWAVQCKCYDENTRITKADVDTFLATSGRTFDNQTRKFSQRLWIATNYNQSNEVYNSFLNQDVPVISLGLADLENSGVDWDKLDSGLYGTSAKAGKFDGMLEHQERAVTAALEHFESHDRGQMIMACGTGKTFTSLKIAEKYTKGNGFVLFLVPSIALLNQTLNEWYIQADVELNTICICSDSEASNERRKDDSADSRIVNLSYPATTNINENMKRFRSCRNKEGMTVVFSTYQSIEVVSKVQKELMKEFGEKAEFDLIICDEAHRTTGIKEPDRDESAFLHVHDNNFIHAKKRLYMTATPRIYMETVKTKAKEEKVELCSMDDVEKYGEEFFHIGFGEAVDKKLLSDYKVIVLTISEDVVPKEMQIALEDPATKAIKTDDATKLVGCINALSKKMTIDSKSLKDEDPMLMHKVVAFCQTIDKSKAITEVYNNQIKKYYDTLSKEDYESVVKVSSQHIDGSMGSATRDQKLSWLKSASDDSDECRILTNVRCLSEGVDVPSLDAVMFLSAKNSQVDVVQSVGRVMRKSKGKKYGYIIIPVVIPSGVAPEDSLDDNERYKVVWTVLNALRSHDDRFDAKIEELKLGKKPKNILVDNVGLDDDSNSGAKKKKEKKDKVGELVHQLTLKFGEFQGAIYARMVKKVGNKRYWSQWAEKVCDIAKSHINRITKLIETDSDFKKSFEDFIGGIQANINPYVQQDEAVEMLAQHLITGPVFEALFGEYSFVKNNSVSVALEKISSEYKSKSLSEDYDTLDKFYAFVRMTVTDIKTAEEKQSVIKDLYESFFKTAFPKTVEKLGIVYTPVEVVDFIINSVADVLKKEFNRDISDKNVHVLDPFTGTGTFITRLLQSGLIRKEDLKRKYEEELHANEIVLLAYYIASINIENTYHDLIGAKEGEYQNFEGICLTDTFQLNEYDEKIKYSDFFPRNVKRVQKQKETPITVIIGNPPYSIGQKSTNDNAQNQTYEKLENKIADTYGRYSTANLNKGLYDSYIKAFRWASDRLDKTGGIIGFITNGIWLDNTSMDGFRKCIEKEFSSIYVFNLRGGVRGKTGDIAKREGQNVFDIMTGVAITILVKNPADAKEKATIYYHDIGDYLSREEKLKIISGFGSVANTKFKTDILSPNEQGDWINLRSELFDKFVSIEPEKKYEINSKSYFTTYSLGVGTNKDAWLYNFSNKILCKDVDNMVNYYNQQRLSYHSNKANIEYDPTKIVWTDLFKRDLEQNVEYKFDTGKIVTAIYRPFCKQYLCYEKQFIQRTYQMLKIFPSGKFSNLVICVNGKGDRKGFSIMIVNKINDLQLLENGQCFPLYWYEEKVENEAPQMNLFALANSDNEDDKYIRHDGVTDFIHNLAKEKYGHKVTKEDIFYYVYGILHSEDYRTKFSADLKKMLPKIPLVDKVEDFWAFSDAGRDLAKLHLNYEDQAPLASVKVIGEESGIFTVDKMKFKKNGKVEDKSEIIYNNYIRITNIPEVAYEYVVNGRSAIEWILEKYQVTTDKASGIKNDPNDWAEEHGKPRYILDLLLSVISLSVATVKIVKSLPKLNFEEEK